MDEYRGRALSLVVVAEACISSGECARIAPQVFGQQAGDGTVTVRSFEPDEQVDELIRRAVAACPSNALRCFED